MLLHIPQVLTAEQVRHCRQLLDNAAWLDGRITAGSPVSYTHLRAHET